MTGYLIDSSALWRLLRGDAVTDKWREVIADGYLRSCYPQRAEFLRSARNLKDFGELCQLFDQSIPDVSVPKSAGTWIGGVQHRAAQAGCVNAFSAVDLQVCATAGYHGLVVVHDDHDFVTATRFATELREINVHEGPFDSYY
ncbi:VapC toxin family PIN domain ribonuclease [Nocardia asteroides]|uniref:VapC toxin family PIN domain ribonuclease n=1 Tax=Nocardia asteroides TaxID=1824 RepID=UPI0037B1329C